MATMPEAESSPVLYGSSQRPYRLAIIGGGPAGTAVLIRAARLGLLSELLGPHKEDDHSYGGVIILEKGSAEVFGSGVLGDFLINSNTAVGTFATNTLEDKIDAIPSEMASGTFLQALRKSKAATQVEAYGEGIGPLPLAGAYLNQVGRALMQEMGRHESSACLCHTAVTSMQQKGADTTQTAATAAGGGGAGGGGWAISVSLNNAQDQLAKDAPLVAYLKDGGKIHAQKVVLACGGRQSGPEFKGLYQGVEDKLMLSDRLLRLGGLEQLQEKIDSAMEKSAEERPVKICVVGGSHSGFSSAWICLTRMEADSFTEGSITILHRNKIKVFYNTKKEAADAGYSDYAKGEVNKRGQVHPFSGLRGDSRELYQAIKSGKETRVRLLETSLTNPASHKAESQALSGADAVIWACGYAANLFPILGPSGEELSFRQSPSGQVDVEETANLVERWSGSVIPSLFAMGLGFGFKSSHDGEEARSDGVGVYQKKGASIILASIFGNKVFGGYNSWAEREEASMAAKAAKRKKGGQGQGQGQGDEDSVGPSNRSSPRAKGVTPSLTTTRPSMQLARRPSLGDKAADTTTATATATATTLPSATGPRRATQASGTPSSRKSTVASKANATSASSKPQVCQCATPPDSSTGVRTGEASSSTTTTTTASGGNEPSVCNVCGGTISKTTASKSAIPRRPSGGSSRSSTSNASTSLVGKRDLQVAQPTAEKVVWRGSGSSKALTEERPSLAVVAVEGARGGDKTAAKGGGRVSQVGRKSEPLHLPSIT